MEALKIEQPCFKALTGITRSLKEKGFLMFCNSRVTEGNLRCEVAISSDNMQVASATHTTAKASWPVDQEAVLMELCAMEILEKALLNISPLAPVQTKPTEQTNLKEKRSRSETYYDYRA